MATSMNIYVSREKMAKWLDQEVDELPYETVRVHGLTFHSEGEEFYTIAFNHPIKTSSVPDWLRQGLSRVTIFCQHSTERALGYYSCGDAIAYVEDTTMDYGSGEVEKIWKFYIGASTLKGGIGMYHQLIEGSISPTIDGTKEQDGWTTAQLRKFDDWANIILWTVEALKNMPIFGYHFRKRLSRIPTS